MEQVAYALRDFLASNNIPTDGVKLTITMPEARHRFAVERVIQANMKPWSVYTNSGLGYGDFNLAGIGIEVTHTKRHG